MFNTFNKKTGRLVILSLISILPLCGLWNIGQAVYIHTKAQLAQVLLETAWAETVHGDKEVKPWPWADTWPVGRLSVPGLGVHRIVLAGTNGSSLAFGPGHFFNSPLPGDDGNSLIAGHRDTHFSFLKQSNTKTLTLITCYPFETVLPGGPLRYVVIANAIAKNNSI